MPVLRKPDSSRGTFQAGQCLYSTSGRRGLLYWLKSDREGTSSPSLQTVPTARALWMPEMMVRPSIIFVFVDDKIGSRVGLCTKDFPMPCMIQPFYLRVGRVRNTLFSQGVSRSFGGRQPNISSVWLSSRPTFHDYMTPKTIGSFEPLTIVGKQG